MGRGRLPSSAVGLGSESMGTSAKWEPGPPTSLVLAVARWLAGAGCVVRGGVEPQYLPLRQPGVEAVLGQQLLVRALLHHAAPVQHHDAVRLLHRAQPVRDDQHRVPLQVPVDGLLDLGKQERPAHAGPAVPTTPALSGLRSRL